MLLAPFLKKWNYTRTLEQISGGHKYLPPRQDVNAPDLYVPLVAVWSYCILRGVAALAVGKFQPDMVYNTVSAVADLLVWVLVSVHPCEWDACVSIVGDAGVAGAVPS